MKSTFKILFYLKRDKQKLDGTVPILCRITIDGKISRFHTKLSVNPFQWDVKTSSVTCRSTVALDINSCLDNMKTILMNV